MTIEKVNIRQKPGAFSGYWNPKIIGELNRRQIKAIKLKGEFIWHQHEHEDEMFPVVSGLLKTEFRDKTAEVREGELIIVPGNTQHRPVAEEEAEILLFEPAGTLNTGDVVNERTRKELEKI